MDSNTQPAPEQLAAIAQEKYDQMWKALEEKQKTIEQNLKKRVVPIVIKDIATPNEYVTGFMYRPDLVTQLKLSDKGQELATGFSQVAAHEVLLSNILRAETDPRITPDTEEGELYWKAAIVCLYEYIKSAVPVLKKN